VHIRDNINKNITQTIRWYLLSSSLIVTVASLGEPRSTAEGSDPGIIETRNCSALSNSLSSPIGIFKGARVSPAGIVTVYGPAV